MTDLKRPIICLTAIDWDYLYHRPQQLMTRLARAGHPVYVRNPRQIAGRAPEEVAAHLWVYRDFAKAPPEVAARAIYFIYFPAYAGWVTPHPRLFIVYDCIDDDPVFDPDEALMLGRADLVLCVSPALLAKHRGKHRRLALLSNGVDFPHYAAESGTAPPELLSLKATRQPLIGFSGAFYNGWVDLELVYAVAAARPDWRIVIVGNAYQWDFSTAPANISYLGIRPYAELPLYLRQFDIGWIPFRDNRISRGADPVKLYEYLAAGLPVVSRDLPFARSLSPPLLYRYGSKPECIGAIERALKDSRLQGAIAKQRRREFARQHSWDSKVEQLLNRLQTLTNL
jgi:teichuronic acid biosynthesis glycosyltransferase TuaH